MEFRKYNSIDNSSRTKTINAIVEQGFAGGEWVSTLKIHGANYSLWYDGNVVKRGKRSGFIGDDDNFMGDINIDYDKNIIALFDYLRSVVPLDNVVVYGEMYGGLYNHSGVDPVNGATRVQKGVYYRPDNDFIVFDIAVMNGGVTVFLNHDDVVKLCIMHGFVHTPVLDIGSFKDLMDKPVTFRDPLSDILGLPPIDDNFAEGWVLKPIKPKFFGNGNRVILKGKSPKFSEKNGGKLGKPPAPVIELSEMGYVALEELNTYLTENRLRNVLSHGNIENIDSKAFGKLLGLFSQDAFKDFMKDNTKLYHDLDKKDQKIVKKRLSMLAGNVIRPVFIDIIDGEF